MLTVVSLSVYNLRRNTEVGALRQQNGSITGAQRLLRPVLRGELAASDAVTLALAFCGQFLISGASDGSLVIWKSKYVVVLLTLPLTNSSRRDWSVASILRGHKCVSLS